jgi:hypothetical protein
MRGPKLFQRKKEDFICEKCDSHVRGDGYTNHCPNCLWSKHVDINPGDRDAVCMGMMEPIRIETVKQETIVTHECTLCTHKKRNKVARNDSIDAQLRIVKEWIQKI